MSGAGFSASSLRQAALTVHAMPDPDRRWLLEALAPSQREALQPLLSELNELGIPRDPGCLPPSEPMHKAMGADRARFPKWPNGLDASDIAALTRVLTREPIGVTQKLLAMRMWPWAGELQSLLGTRAGEQAAATPLPMGARLQAALLEALEAGVRAEREAQPAAAPVPGRWQRMRARLVTLGRSA